MEPSMNSRSRYITPLPTPTSLLVKAIAPKLSLNPTISQSVNGLERNARTKAGHSGGIITELIYLRTILPREGENLVQTLGGPKAQPMSVATPTTNGHLPEDVPRVCRFCKKNRVFSLEEQRRMLEAGSGIRMKGNVDIIRSFASSPPSGAGPSSIPSFDSWPQEPYTPEPLRVLVAGGFGSNNRFNVHQPEDFAERVRTRPLFSADP
ncbi:hypothetical protein B0H19DRAFT_1056475 [Mycena capillaripes]|nr:hypothetical protein B0H19DRAFT_1056475 [Mycena capillaripes]